MKVRISVTSRPGAPSRDLVIADIIARTGIDEAMIDRLVRTFYSRARLDQLIGPIFENRVHDWEGHLGRMCAFWSSVTLMSGRYHGQPMVAHLPLSIDSPHFDRWLEIFAATARDVCRQRPPISSTALIGSPTASNWALRPRRERSGRSGRDRRAPFRRRRPLWGRSETASLGPG
jgi:truncated hemoglobin YjbI